jgi:1-deoxy-D-xylulose-5-phosphate reductoisomerase
VLNHIEKVILTASGGPFRGRSRAELEGVNKAQALKHPNWSMGAKITIDSASMMNKGLEVIEAKWLFNLTMDQVDVIIHPQSIIHSCVQFQDGSIKAQLGLPDMKLPIQYALGYPQRLPNSFERFDFLNYPQLTFEKPDLEAFRNLALAFEPGKRGGNAPCILNAANEVAVSRFLADEISFLELTSVVEYAMNHVSWESRPDLQSLLSTDTESRMKAKEYVPSSR